MSEKALDHNMVPIWKNECSSKESFTKPFTGPTSEKLDETETKIIVPLVGVATNGDGTLNSGSEVGTSEVEYVDSENLSDIEDVNITLETLLVGLESKEWISVCEALNNVRRLSIFRKETISDRLENVMTLIVKSLKNPRSAVCKTAIMTSEDVFKAYGDNVIDFLDPMLVQLLLKSSQDKRFVCEAAERALIAMTTWLSPILLLPKLQPYLKNKNPRIRAKASMCFSRSVPQLGVEGIKVYGIEKLIQIGAAQLSDQLPESREAARSLLLEVQAVYEQSQELASTTVTAISEDDKEEMSSWEKFCHSNLTRFSAQAVLRVTNIARSSTVLGS